MNRKLLVLALTAATLAIGNVYASTNTATGTFNVTIDVANSCTITVNDVAFGSVTSLIPAHTANSGADNVTCTGTSPVTVTFNAGSGTYGTRTMVSGTDIVNYNLYTDNTYTTVLGDTSLANGTVSIGLTPSGGNAVHANDQFTVYGQTAANQAVNNGSYSDSITATVTF